jgi:mono/diheme cytochrome c family protein
MRNQILASVAMAVLGACVGGIDAQPPGGGDDTPPGGTGTARALFDSSVAPLLTAKCAACHVGPETSATNEFLGAEGPPSFYDSIVADRAVNGGFNPAAATLLLEGAHQGPAWSPDEATKISAWLAAELTARGATVTPPGGTTGTPLTSVRGAEMAFVGCMTTSVTDYTTIKPYQVADMNTAQGRCSSCHSPGGAGGQWLGQQNQYKDMFAKWQEEVFFTGVFQAQLQTDNTYKISTAESKICAKGDEKDNNLGTHPSFDCQQNNGTALKALKDFATKVQAKVDAHDPTCGPAAFSTPTP